MSLSELLKDRDRVILPISLFVLTVITRIPFISKLLYHMDSVQFALALENYDITVHQPHPPGYFLYVMLGRLFNYFISDANTAFVSISIIFSGLTVVAVYYMGRELFDKKTAIIAGILALTSPNLWFHGEVVFSYAVEAFFSVFIAYLCWHVIKGKEDYVWGLAIVLAISGGIRQNTPVFLFPLWLYSINRFPFRKIAVSIGLFAIISLSWFIPMILLTGGWDAYLSALKHLLQSTVSHGGVFKVGWSAFKFHSLVLFNFLIYGAGGGVVLLIFSIYHIIRNGRLAHLDKAKVSFFSLWMLPSFFFFLLIAIHPAVSGHVLIFLPPLLLLTAKAITYSVDELKKLTNRGMSIPIVLALVFINLYIFFFSNYTVSYRMIREHDKKFSDIRERLNAFDPSSTVIFSSQNYIYYGLTHVIYYLPDFMIYDPGVFPSGENRWGGANKNTFLANGVVLPEKIQSFVTLLYEDDISWNSMTKSNLLVQPIFMEILPTIYMVSGPIRNVDKVYPDLKIRYETFSKDTALQVSKK